jgi:hypothetical protein
LKTHEKQLIQKLGLEERRVSYQLEKHFKKTDEV